MELKDLNNLLTKTIALQKKQKLRSLIVVIALVVLGAFLLFESNFFTAKKVTENIQKDSTYSNPIYKNVIKKQNDEISSLLADYFDYRSTNNINEVSKYYSDTTFEFFYSYPNQFIKNIKPLTKSEILKIDKIDFKKNEMNDYRIFDFEDIISISTIPNTNNLVVFVKGKQISEDKKYDSILEVKLDSKRKIFSIRSFVDSFRKM